MDFIGSILSGLGDAILKNLIILIPPIGAITFFVEGLKIMWKKATGRDLNKVLVLLLPSLAGVVYLWVFQKPPYDWKFIFVAGMSLGVFNNFLYAFIVKRFFEMLRARALAKLSASTSVKPPTGPTNGTAPAAGKPPVSP